MHLHVQFVTDLSCAFHREHKVTSGNLPTYRKAQDKENKGRSSATKSSHSTKSMLTSSSSKWNRRHPSITSNGSSSAFVKPVRFHHGNSTPINGGGLFRSREPTTATAWCINSLRQERILLFIAAVPDSPWSQLDVQILYYTMLCHVSLPSMLHKNIIYTLCTVFFYLLNFHDSVCLNTSAVNESVFKFGM